MLHAACCGLEVVGHVVETASSGIPSLHHALTDYVNNVGWGYAGVWRDTAFILNSLPSIASQLSADATKLILNENMIVAPARGRVDMYIPPYNIGGSQELLDVNRRVLVSDFLAFRAKLQTRIKAERPHVVAYKKHVYMKMLDILDAKKCWMSDENVADELNYAGYKEAAVLDSTGAFLLWNSRDVEDCQISPYAPTCHGFNFPAAYITLEESIEHIGRDYDPVGDLIEQRRRDIGTRPTWKGVGKWTGDGPPAFRPSSISVLLGDLEKRTEWEMRKATYGPRTRTPRS